jgi:hypothetical protein
MAHTEYNVKKIRFGCNGKWNSWEYEAVSMKADYSQTGNAAKGITGRYSLLDLLAQELATFPEVDNARFIPGYVKPEVSLCKLTSTQRAVVSDEELGELGMLILKYVKEKAI